MLQNENTLLFSNILQFLELFICQNIKEFFALKSVLYCLLTDLYNIKEIKMYLPPITWEIKNKATLLCLLFLKWIVKIKQYFKLTSEHFSVISKIIYFLYYIILIYIQLLITEPSGPPQNIRVISKSQTWILLAWNPPLESERNGEIINYIITYENREAQKFSERINVITVSIDCLLYISYIHCF